MVEKQFQFCVFDPEGDYDELDHAISVGNVKTPPNEEAVLKLLRKSATNAVVNTQALEIGARPTVASTEGRRQAVRFHRTPRVYQGPSLLFRSYGSTRFFRSGSK
jgi:hypothetical protein